jgi:hypothetical protein
MCVSLISLHISVEEHFFIQNFQGVEFQFKRIKRNFPLNATVGRLALLLQYIQAIDGSNAVFHTGSFKLQFGDFTESLQANSDIGSFNRKCQLHFKSF